MTDHTCGAEPSEIDAEDLFSGYLDDVLTQADGQKVRLRLDACAACRQLVDELRAIRENARTTRFKAPEDALEAERPRGLLSRVLRSTGWLVLIVWFVMNIALIFFLDLEDDGGFVRLIVGASLLGWGLLLASVLIDRLRERRTDRYRGVAR